MENQVVTPNQNNLSPPSPLTPASQPTPPTPTTPDPSNNPGSGSPINFNSDSPNSVGMSGKLSLLLSSLAVGIFILLIFTGLVNSPSKAYAWLFVILALGIAGLIFGLLSEKGKDKINLLGLVGIILSVIVCINCLIIGSYYIKLQIELNKFKTQTNTQLNGNFDSSPYNP